MKHLLIGIALVVALGACAGDEPQVGENAPASAGDGDAGVSSGVAAQTADQAAPGPALSPSGPPPATAQGVDPDIAAMLAADPKSTVLGRAKACIARDRRAFVTYYASEYQTLFAAHPEHAESAFKHACGPDDLPAEPIPDIDGVVAKLMVSFKKTGRTDNLGKYPVYWLCMTEQPQDTCDDSDFEVTLENGRVVFVAD